ncbi:MAG: TrbI/VirB10 family protein [Candidatus Obscuribacterales bacterium]|jgi:hypothetical protein|nr:TrbI/VirB10 family protein [Candidatus Obscuribacterales bacterium]
MSRRVVHVLASILILSQTTLAPVMAADSSQVNFKIFSAPGAPAAEPAEKAESSSADKSAESIWSEGDASSQSPPAVGGTEEPKADTSTPTKTESTESDSSASASTTTPVEAAAASSGEGKVLQGYIRVVPSGTKVPIIMDSAIDSDTSQEGDEFAARTSEDLTIDGNTCVPAGSVIKGRIARLNAPRHLSRSGSVALKFDTITTPDNRQIPLVATLVARGGVVHARRGLKDIAMDMGTFALPTALGLGIGVIAGGASNSSSGVGAAGGALIGAGIGAAIGVIVLCAKKGKRVDVRPGDEMKIELAEDLRMPM